jgi:hypothetical protein
MFDLQVLAYQADITRVTTLLMGRETSPLVAGGAAGTLSGGLHINYPDNTPMANLLLTMLDKAGVPTQEKIGDSTEHLNVT